MTARKPKSELKPNGRKSLYEKRFDNMAYIACSEGGMSDNNLGKLFGVTEQTINNWKRVHPTFFESIRNGKDYYDSIKIEKSLNRIANGFSYSEKVKEPIIVNDAEGKPILDKNGDYQTKLRTVRVTTKKVTPNERAIEFWLRNRNRKRWPDTQQIDHGITDKLADHSTKLAAARKRKAKGVTDEK